MFVPDRQWVIFLQIHVPRTASRIQADYLLTQPEATDLFSAGQDSDLGSHVNVASRITTPAPWAQPLTSSRRSAASSVIVRTRHDITSLWISITRIISRKKNGDTIVPLEQRLFAPSLMKNATQDSFIYAKLYSCITLICNCLLLTKLIPIQTHISAMTD